MLNIRIFGSTTDERFSHECGPLEFGRGPRRDVPRRSVEDAGVSGDQLRVEELGPGRIRLENLSREFEVRPSGGAGPAPGGVRDCDQPGWVSIGRTTIEIDSEGPDDRFGRTVAATVAPLAAGANGAGGDRPGEDPATATRAGDPMATLADVGLATTLPGACTTIPGEGTVPETRAPQDDPYRTTVAPGTTEPDQFATRTHTVGDHATVPGRSMESSGPRFQILRPHAKGGLGEVFVAHDGEVRREVALKEIQAHYADRFESRARFLLEAEITGGLEHPGIVPVYGLGQYPDGRPYYAMRFIRGDSLKQAIERFHAADKLGRDPGERALQLRGLLRRFVDVCNAMAYAHSRCILHRDLKPGNIMLGPYGETLVVDWGLAKPIGSQDSPSDAAGEPGSMPLVPSNSSATVMGAAIGTPQFMSPEQAEGDQDRMGPASDIYSLGATLYALLTGKPPFTGQGGGDILAGVRRGEFPPPRQVHPAVDPALEAICLKAMKLRPEDRYPTARALADDLEHWLADEPVSAWREPFRKRAARWARRHRTLVTASATAALVALLAGGYVLYEAQLRAARRLTEATGRVRALETAEVPAIPSIIEALGRDRRLVHDQLAKMAAGDGSGGDDRRRIPAALALLPDEPKQADFLVDALLKPDATPDEVLVIRDALADKAPGGEVAPRLRAALPAAAGDLNDAQLRAAGALARLAPDDPLWAGLAGPIARKLVRENPLRIHAWRQVFEPISPTLRAPLQGIYADRDRPEARALAYTLLFAYATRPRNPDAVGDLAALVGDADVEQFLQVMGRLDAPAIRERAIALLTPKIATPARFDDVLAHRQGRWAMALLKLGRPEAVWPLFRFRDDPSVRTELIHDLARFGFPAGPVVARLGVESDVSARRALILCLGEFRADALDAAGRDALVAKLLALYRDDPDPGMHGAISWLLRRPGWDHSSALKAADGALATPAPVAGRDWYVDGQGQTFSVVRGPREFVMGSTEQSDPNRQLDEPAHLRRIGRSFAIAAREVTLAEYGKFLDGKPEGVTDWRPNPQFRKDFPSPESAIGAVTWYDAARYCNWLSAREHLPEDQWCYPKRIAAGMVLPDDFLKRTGYRLPTEAEWEYACRAGVRASRPYGRSNAWLGEYEWYKDNAGGTMHPVGRKMPNDLGLFDLLGNALEWCADPYRKYPGTGPIDDLMIPAPFSDQEKRVLRGGTFNVTAYDPRSAIRYSFPPSFQQTLIGFRIARTCP